MAVRALPASLDWHLDWRLVRAGIGLAFVVYAWWLTVSNPIPQIDTWTYYIAWQGGLYDGAWNTPTSYVYSPVFAQLLAPLTLLPWALFVGLWMAAMAAGLVWLVGFWWAGLLATMLGPAAAFLEGIVGDRVPYSLMADGFGYGMLATGNVTILLAVAIRLGFRYPTWGFVLLTKVAPGIGLLWFVVRREWRHLAITLGVTAAVVTVSFVAAPGLWLDWIARIAAPHPPAYPDWLWLDTPLLPRLVIAAALVTVGALRGYRWTVYMAAFLALPAVWFTSEVILLAALASRRRTLWSGPYFHHQRPEGRAGEQGDRVACSSVLPPLIGV